MENMSDFIKMLTDKMGGDPNAILHMMQSSGNTANTENSAPSMEMPDWETMMKMKKIIEQMNADTNDPSVTLLNSLKPYLQGNKKTKIDQYIKFIRISKAMSAFQEWGGDSQ